MLTRTFLFLLLTIPTVALAQRRQPTPRRQAKNNVTTFGGIQRPIKQDSVRADSTKKIAFALSDSLLDSGDLKAKVKYDSKDSTIMTADDQLVELYGDAQLDYEDIHLTADYILINWKTQQIFASGRKDSTGNVSGEPVFQQGQDTYNSKEIRYNFESKRASIKGIITKQGEGNIRGESVKKDSSNNFYLTKAFYTTCDLLHPHFGIRASQIKMVQGKGDNRSVVSGPFNLVIADVPLPLGLPFGFFPFSETRRSGIVMGNYGEEPQNRGFYLRDFGYYWAVNEHLGLKFTGQIYSRGGWGLGSQGNYLKKYRYNGSFTLSFNKNRTGDEIGPNRQTSNDFSIRWSHTPQTLGRPYNFSANIDITSSNFTRNNEQNIIGNGSDLGRFQQNVFSSGVSFSYRISPLVQSDVALRISQNVQTKAFTATPTFNIGIAQLQPFVRKKAVTTKWYDSFRIGLNLSANADFNNNVLPVFSSGNSNFREFRVANYVAPKIDSAALIASGGRLPSAGIMPLTVENLPALLKNTLITSTFSVPISLPNFKISKKIDINLTPGVNLQGNLYTKRYDFRYVAPTANDSGGVAVDTTSGVFAAYNYATSLSLNSRLYGTFYFKKLGRLQAIRHTFAPAISLNYTPDFSDEGFGFYRRVQINSRGDSRVLSRFQGYSGSVGRSAALGFSITNQLEAKLRAKSDTAKEAFEKIKLLDNFGLSGGYNFIADSFRVSNLSFSANTVLFKNYNINFASSFDPYQFVEDPFFPQTGRRINRLKISDGKGLWSVQSMNIGMSTSFRSGGDKKPKPKPTPNGANPQQMAFVQANPNMYLDWDVPWSLMVSYNFSYSRFGLSKPQTFQTLSMSGDLTLTEKWKMTFSTGFDFVAKAPSLTNIGLTRNLHCWEATFNWTPIASAQSFRSGNYNFELRARSSLLKDLKLTRRRSFVDRAGF